MKSRNRSTSSSASRFELLEKRVKLLEKRVIDIDGQLAGDKAEEAVKIGRPGQLIPGKGVFLGIWSPHGRDGVSLGKTFNVFAAPYDLGLDETGRGTKQILKYKDAVKCVSDIRSLMGHDGADYKNDTELYAALKNGSYKGEWFIPTREMIVGTDIGGKQVQTGTLFAHKGKGAFKNTFTLASGSDHAHWYWSCSERREDPSDVYDVRLSDGFVFWFFKDTLSLSCRVLRAELRP